MDSGSKYGVVGDDTLDVPVTKVDEQSLKEELKASKFSKTEEFKKLKQYLESRIEWYQQYLPDGRDVRNIDLRELEQRWVIANSVITEFKAVINAYERAAEAVNAQRTKT